MHGQHESNYVTALGPYQMLLESPQGSREEEEEEEEEKKKASVAFIQYVNGARS